MKNCIAGKAFEIVENHNEVLVGMLIQIPKQRLHAGALHEVTATSEVISEPTEDLEEFVTLLNKAAREDDDGNDGGSGVDWQIGVQKGRTRGWIHRDWVEMTAAEAAEAGVVGIFPRSGWWKERPYLGKGSSKARYSLVVAIRTPETEVDLYKPVAIEVAPGIQV